MVLAVRGHPAVQRVGLPEPDRFAVRSRVACAARLGGRLPGRRRRHRALQGHDLRAVRVLRQHLGKPDGTLRRLRHTRHCRVLAFDRAGDHGRRRRHGLCVRLSNRRGAANGIATGADDPRGLGDRGLRRDIDAVDDLPAQRPCPDPGREIRGPTLMALLEVSDLSKTFGGVLAVQNVSFSVEAGIVYSVIGPNGAGKTTLFNLITGIYEPNSGEIRLDGELVTGRAPHELARKGVARTFQNLQICMNMTAIENVMVGGHLSLDRNLIKGMLRFPSLRRADAVLRKKAAELMAYVGLNAYRGAEAGAMPYGALKRLEIARALAAQPRILFLD